MPPLKAKTWPDLIKSNNYPFPSFGAAIDEELDDMIDDVKTAKEVDAESSKFRLTGSFDLYAMDLEPLSTIYAPGRVKPWPNYAFQDNGNDYGGDLDDDDDYILHDDPQGLYLQDVNEDRKGYQMSLSDSSTESNPVPESPVSPTSPLHFNTVFPEELYKAIRNHQASNMRTGNVTIPEDHSSPGIFTSRLFLDSKENVPYNMMLTNIEYVNKIHFTSYYERPKRGEGGWVGPGVTGKLSIQSGETAHSNGTFCMHPLWRNIGSGGKHIELFEGCFNVEIKHANTRKKGGHETGVHAKVDFWGIRGTVISNRVS